jgi:hypothetical protein
VPPTPSSADSPPSQSSIEEDTNDTDTDTDDLPTVGKVWEGERRSLSSMFAAQRAAAAPPMPPSAEAALRNQTSADEGVGGTNIDPTNHAAVWQAFLARIADQGASLHGVLTQARLAAITDGQAVIRISPQHETFLTRLQSNGKQDLLRNLLSELLQQPTGIRFELDDAPPPESQPSHPRTSPSQEVAPQSPPAAYGEPAQIPLTPELRQELESDPLIEAVMRELGGQLLNIRKE